MSDDLISRQAAIEAVESLIVKGYDLRTMDRNSGICKARDELLKLPSAQPETSRIENALHGKTAEEQCDFIRWLVHDYAMCFTDSRQAIIEWLKGQHNE